jgi:hypothetical protein
VEAVTDPRALLDAYAEEVVDIESDFGVFEPIKRADAAGAMLVALRAVLDRHGPMQYGDEATDDDFEPTDQWCKECSGDSFHRARFPCRTRRDITAALTSGDTP